jgi:hypothetical protein
VTSSPLRSVAIVAVLAACSPESQRDGVDAERSEQSAGDSLVAMSWSAYRALPEHSGELLTRVCQEEALPACQFGKAFLGAVGTKGEIVFSDGRVVVGARAGQYRVGYSLSRTGSGPGEFRAPFALGTDSGTFSIFDIRRMRVITLSEDGTLIDEVGAIPPRSFVGIRVHERRAVALTIPPANAIGETVTAHILRHSQKSDTAWEDTLLSFPTRALFTTGREGLFGPPIPFEPKHLWQICSGGALAVAHGDRFELRQRRGGSATIVTTVKGAKAMRIPTSRRDSAQSSLRRPGGASGVAPSYAQVADSFASLVPETYPFIQEILCGPASTFLVLTATTTGKNEWDIVDARGVITGRLVVPSNWRLLVGGEPNLLVAVTRDDGREELWTARIVQ